jgi:hypothetical protein
MEAPERALGASGRCPRCSSFFTVVPGNEDKLAGRQTQPAAAPARAKPAVDSTTTAPPPPSVAVLPARPPRPNADNITVPHDGGDATNDPEPLEKPAWIEPIGLVALLLGGAALWSTTALALLHYVVPLALTACLVGLVGLCRALIGNRYRSVFPLAGTLLGTAVSLAGLMFPELLGPLYQAGKATATVQPTAIRVTPLGGSGGGEQADWVDASRVALQQGRLRLQVVSAAIGPLKKDSEKKDRVHHLLVRVRSQRPKDKNDASEPWKERPQPLLSDNTGRIYSQHHDQVIVSDETRRVFPIEVVDQVFAFDIPPRNVDYLRLELSAAPWGGTGVFRFTIPSSMIQREK